MTTSSARTVLASVDDHLGPAEQRFFGRGFRRVGYDIGATHLSHTADGSVLARSSVGVRYPADWSKKGASTDLRPHFSTVDGIVIAAQLAEACLSTPGADLRDAWLRKVRMTAGASPQEDLDHLPAEATLRHTDPVAGDPTRAVSVVDCAVGTMRIRCEVEHAYAPARPGNSDEERTYSGLEAILGPTANRYFGTGFTTRRQLVRDVDVDHRALRADATLAVTHENGALVPTAGLEGTHQPSVSVIDAFVTALQLAQIMLYDLDGMRRQDSNTLWMRQTTLTASRPDRPTEGIRVTTRLDEPGLLRMGGGVWRTLDVVAELAGLHVRSSVAHRLPEGTAAI
ncbi:AvrD family protein [Streptantibioticus ferralitis]|uniref:AvrD family protein n=1 Tax=Streptantibioticus ferralitis TaxID=236510 RepID=A0ABT5YRV4_9ACTN|nr:AvrD family protein [Streptantibioticus ferralitis]MDF2254303.1 AvrD family protein [Streptantibioticus ferralitis]